MKNRIFSLLAALTLTLALLVGISVLSSAEGEAVGECTETNMSLAENITVGFAFNIENADEGAYAEVAYPDGKSESIPLASALKSGSRYVIFADVAVKELYDDVTVSVFSTDGQLICQASESAADYCERYLERLPEGEFCELIGALKAYADAAIDYFITEGDSALGACDFDFESIPDPVMKGAFPEGLRHRSATLILESEMTVRHYFELTGDKAIGEYSFYVDLDKDGRCDDGETLTPKEKSGVYYVDIEGITPNELDNAYRLCVAHDGTNEYSYDYGPLTYAKRTYLKASSSNDVKNLAAAIAAYNGAASKLKGSVIFITDKGSAVESLQYEYGVTTAIPSSRVPTAAADSKDVFAGWFDASGKRITEISPSSVGDVTLSAKWVSALYLQSVDGLDSKVMADVTSAADSDLLTVNVPAGNTKTGVQIYVTPTAENLTLNMTVAKAAGLDFIGFGIRLRSASGNPGNFVGVSDDGKVTVGGEVIANITETPTAFSFVFADHPTKSGTMTIDVYVNSELTSEGVEYTPGFGVADVRRFYMLFSYNNTQATAGSLYFGDLALIDGEVIPTVYPDEPEDVGGATIGTVTFMDGDEQVGTMDYECGRLTPVTMIPTPSAQNLVFAGWFDGDGRRVTEIPVTAVGNITLSAKWATALYTQTPGVLPNSAGGGTIVDDGNGLLSVTVPAGSTKTGFNVTGATATSGALTVNVNLAKVAGLDFIGFGVRLRSGTNTSDFMSVSNGGTVSVCGMEVATVTETLGKLTLIFRDNPDAANPIYIDVYFDGELVAEALEYSPKGLRLSDLTRFYLLFNYNNANDTVGSLYFRDLELIDGEVIPQKKNNDSSVEDDDMNENETVDVSFSTVMMNVGADETKRNLVWYSNRKAEGEIRWVKASELVDGKLPSVYKSASAIVNDTTGDGYSYKATIFGLEENTEYAYQLVTADTLSDIYTFAVKDFSVEYSFVFAGDPQVGVTGAASWSDTILKIEEEFPDVALIVSAGDQTSTATNEKDYETFIVPELSRMPVAVTLGPGHDNANTYTMHYYPPNLSTNYGVSTTTSDYFFKYNGTLFISINVESGNMASHSQFIRNTVKNNPECIWQVVFVHYSAYSGCDFNTSYRALSALYAECGIDVVLSGHDHVYARSELIIDDGVVSDDVIVNNSVTDPDGVLYICGAPSTSAAGFTADPGKSDYTLKQCFEVRKSVVVFDMTENSMTLTAYFLDGDEPEEFDSFTIYRTNQSANSPSADSFSVTYVTDPEAPAEINPSDYTTHLYTAGDTLDPIALTLPSGSVADGVLFEWEWVYYSLDGEVVSSFSAGGKYIARLVKTTLKVSDTLYIASATNAERGVYTWADAWDIVNRFPGTSFKLSLVENIVLSSGDFAVAGVPTNVVIDLAGYTLNSTAIDYLIRLNNGTDKSNISIITSKDGGTLKAKSVFYMLSGSRTNIHISIGSADSKPVTVSGTYLIDGGNNYKNSSHLYLDLYEGNYSFSSSLLYVIAYSENYNYYYVTAKDADISVGKSVVDFHTTYCARQESFFKAVGSSFTYTGSGEDAPFFTVKSQWLGTTSFENCSFDGISAEK